MDRKAEARRRAEGGLTASIIIPTYNRPKELEDCIRTILSQTRVPDELIVIDDGNLEELPLRGECEERGIGYRYRRKDKPGLTESRNVGITMAEGDIVFFLDDDILLEDEYVEKIMEVFVRSGDGNLAGVGGVATNVIPVGWRGRLRTVLGAPFFVYGFTEGKVLPSGFAVEYGDTGKVLTERRRVDFLPGGICAYRREIFDEFLFTEGFHSFGFGEDKDFSYRVSRKYTLLVCPEARLVHLRTPTMRADKYNWGRLQIMGRYLFFRENVKRSDWDWIYFWLAVFWYSAERLAAAVVRPKRDNWMHLRGVLSASGEILFKRVKF